ncbi:TolB family protein [Paenibacillus sp. FSL K6-1558]|uniref:TolB family protein n=1 Tax=Paenibacillus sp. FSL K6-1558 TaxID=2921473 RepID=UPI0030FB470E
MMIWMKVTFGALGAAALLITVACGSTTEPSGNTQGAKTGTDITVKDNTNTSVYQNFKLEKIDKLPNMRGIAWLSESSIVTDKENTSMKPVSVEGEERYPHNLYMVDLTKGTDTPLIESEVNLGAPQVSPDGQHLFYWQTEETTGWPFILNLKSGEAVAAGEEDGFVQEGAWLDNEHVVFSNMKGDLISAALDGTTKVLVETGNFNVRSIKVSGNMIYYITGEDGQLNTYDTKTGEAKQVLKSVEWVIPSNDGTRLAIVKRTADTKRALVLTDLEGNEKATLARGTQIFGTSWSGDDSKIAYTINSDKDNEKGLFVSNTESAEQFQISAEMDNVADSLAWSPQGNKILLSQSVMENEKYHFVTSIITISE